MSARALLVEIGVEELPPSRLRALGETFAANLAAAFGEDGFDLAAHEGFATPRRLAARITGLSASQAGRVIERKGPALERAYDEAGQPTPAAQGFARACRVAVGDLQVSDDGKRVCFRRREAGATVQALLEEKVRGALLALPVGKRMRWGDAPYEFIRPVRWVLALYGDEPLALEVMGVRSGGDTRGHRRHCPGPLRVPDAKAGVYEDVLERRGKVIASFAERRRRVEAQVAGAAAGRALAGAARRGAESLLDEVTAMTEWPSAMVARFDPSFLSLPAEVIVEVLEHDQKFFPLEDGAGRLTSDFVAVANVESASPESVRLGYERVVSPRLADAAFFFDQDRKRGLASRVAELEDVLFHEKLGSLADKTRRLERLAALLAESVGGVASGDATRAARLCKADLTTDVVREYPELEGVIGGYYARADGESETVARAVAEHRLPRRAGDELPQSAAGVLLALADRLDTLAGIFGSGEHPSGSKDPYGLRRAGLALVRIVLEKRLDLDLGVWMTRAADGYRGALDPENVARLPGYLLDRVRGYYAERGCGVDEVEAAVAVRPLQLLDLDARLAAVRRFKALPQTGSLTAANKRIRNILEKDAREDVAGVDARALRHAAENGLYRAYCERRERVAHLAGRREYLEALNVLVELHEPINRFFDEVLVMSEDQAERRNRIGLLREVRSLFTCIADFSKLETPAKAA